MNREEFNEQSLIDRIESRINAEYRKHKDLDWAKIAAIKIVHALNDYKSSLPSAEGAEEILNEIIRKKLNLGKSFKATEQPQDYFPITIGEMSEMMQEFSALTADKLAEERLRAITERCKKLEFMIENGLGWEDMRNDITMPHEI